VVLLRALRVKLSGWVGLFPDPPFTGLCRKLFAGGLKFWVVGSGTFFAKPSKPGSSRFQDVSRRSRRGRRKPSKMALVTFPACARRFLVTGSARCLVPPLSTDWGSGCLNLIRVYSCDSWKKSGFLRGGPTNHTNDSRMPKKRGQSVASLEGATHASAVVEPDLRAGFAARACTKRARRSRSTSIPFIRFATWQAQSLPRPTSLHGLGSRGLSLLPMILLGR